MQRHRLDLEISLIILDAIFRAYLLEILKIYNKNKINPLHHDTMTINLFVSGRSIVQKAQIKNIEFAFFFYSKYNKLPVGSESLFSSLDVYL